VCFVVKFLIRMIDFETRFAGIARLYGREGLAKLRAASVCVVGIGGVGAWAAEALARSGVGALTLVDLDEVCASNINRQLHALTQTVGRAKVAVMAERIQAINPDCRVTGEQKFFNEQTAAELLAPGFDYVLDAIDSVTNKVLLLACCRQKNLPAVACGAAGGRRDGTQVRTADLATVSHDRLLAEVRKKLRKEFQFPADGAPMGVECVFSAEPPVFAQPDGSVCENRALTDEGTRLNCDGGLGSATFVTGAFGFAAAGIVVRRIAESDEGGRTPRRVEARPAKVPHQ
jgi:tRNA A37 threonylcarbamoyladenosine dehydratase